MVSGMTITPPASDWLARWRETNSDIAQLSFTHRMADAVIDEQRGRDIRIGEQWLADFASCNYLGFDLDEEILDAIPGYLAKWGSHPSWSRIIASPVLYEQIEEQLAELCGTEDVLALPTITHIHFSVLPVLAAGGTVFLDSRSHKTVFDGATAAKATGADVKTIGHNNLDRLQARLEAGDWKRPGVIALDGVNSMTGNLPDLVEYARLAREHDAILYVDDAHGFGVIGERHPDELSPYGTKGNAIVRYLGENYDNVVLIGALSKAYSSLMAFLAIPTELKTLLKSTAPPYVYSGPSPVASLATVLEGLRVNRERGDQIRQVLHDRTKRIRTRSTSYHSMRATSPGCRSSRSRWPRPRPGQRGGRPALRARPVRDDVPVPDRSTARGGLPPADHRRQRRGARRPARQRAARAPGPLPPPRRRAGARSAQALRPDDTTLNRTAWRVKGLAVRRRHRFARAGSASP